MRSILEDLAERKQFPGQMDIIISILQIYNCRASEVLEAKWENFFPNNYLILEGKKKSANVIVRDRIILNAISLLPRIHKDLIFYQVDYYKLYHYCRKHFAHLFVKFKSKKYYKVTHGFRYANVEFINNEFYIRDVLSHRSVISGRFYKIKKKGSSNEQK